MEYGYLTVAALLGMAVMQAGRSAWEAWQSRKERQRLLDEKIEYFTKAMDAFSPAFLARIETDRDQVLEKMVAFNVRLEELYKIVNQMAEASLRSARQLQAQINRESASAGYTPFDGQKAYEMAEIAEKVRQGMPLDQAMAMVGNQSAGYGSDLMGEVNPLAGDANQIHFD